MTTDTTYKTNLKILFAIVLFSVFCFVFLLSKILLDNNIQDNIQNTDYGQVTVIYPESLYYRTVEFGSVSEQSVQAKTNQKKLIQKSFKPAFYDAGTPCDDSRQCLGFCEVFSKNETRGLCSQINQINLGDDCFYYLLDGKAKAHCY